MKKIQRLLGMMVLFVMAFGLFYAAPVSAAVALVENLAYNFDDFEVTIGINVDQTTDFRESVDAPQLITTVMDYETGSSGNKVMKMNGSSVVASTSFGAAFEPAPPSAVVRAAADFNLPVMDTQRYIELFSYSPNWTCYKAGEGVRVKNG